MTNVAPSWVTRFPERWTRCPPARARRVPAHERRSVMSRRNGTGRAGAGGGGGGWGPRDAGVAGGRHRRVRGRPADALAADRDTRGAGRRRRRGGGGVVVPR